MKALSLAVLAQLQVLETEKALGKNVYACSTKQVKRLLKDPSVCIFAVLASAKAAKLQMNAKELNLAYHFASKHFKDCDEFINNVFCLDLVEVPILK